MSPGAERDMLRPDEETFLALGMSSLVYVDAALLLIRKKELSTTTDEDLVLFLVIK